MEAQHVTPNGAESAAETTPAYDAARWRKWTYVAYAVILVFVVHLGYEILQQSSIEGLVEELGTPEWQQAKQELVDYGTAALPYVSRAFYYDVKPVVRQRAGGTLLVTFQDLLKTAPKPPEGIVKKWNAWKQEEKLAPGIILTQLLGRAETCEDPEIVKIAPVMQAWLEWQMWLRHTVQSEMITKALGDEDPAVRQLAAKLVRIFGFEQGIEHKRYVQWRNMERLITRMDKELAGISTRNAKAMRKQVTQVAEGILKQWEARSIVGEFGNGALIGMMDASDDLKVRLAAADILDEILASAYRADNREEMVRLVGGRRLRALMTMLASPKAGTLQVKKMLSYSPNMYKKNPQLVSSMQLKLERAKAKGETAFERALSRCMGIFTDVEEGRKLGREQHRYLLAN